MISAVSHPTRRRILRAFVAEPLWCASTIELAEAIEQPVAQVGYHLKALTDCEILELGRGGDRDAVAGSDRGWSLAVAPDWLGLVLDVWQESRAAG